MPALIEPATLRLFAAMLELQAENARREEYRAERLENARIAREIALRIDAGMTKPEIMVELGLNRNEHGGFWDVCPRATQSSIDRIRARAAQTA